MFGKRTLDGPVFLGLDTQEIVQRALEKPVNQEIVSDVYSFVHEFANEDNLLVIDDSWVSYVRDLRFDYFNKKIFIPYFEYKKHVTKSKVHKLDGHLYVDDNTEKAIVRYDYSLCAKEVCLGDMVVMYSVSSDIKLAVRLVEYVNSSFISSLETLYQMYLDSCYFESTTALDKHTGGYHIVGKDIKRLNDREEGYRKKLKLKTFSDSSLSQDILNYRDVRQFQRDEVFKKVGFRNELNPYWKRIIDFESYLYCLLRSGKQIEESEYVEEFVGIGVSTDYMKYGDQEIKLILKGYWKPDGKLLKSKSWSRL